MKPGLEKKTEVYCQHMERLTGIPCYPVDLEEKDERREPLCSLCQICESIRGGLCDGWQEAMPIFIRLPWSGSCGWLLITKTGRHLWCC